MSPTIFSRIGGDEFVVILDSNPEQMEKLEEELKSRIEEYNSKETYALSMAVGKARLNGSDGSKGSISDWKMNADMEMYRAKDNFYKENRRSRV